MNILYLCDEYPPGQHGGIGTSVRSLAREMIKQGHHVVVAGLYGPGFGGQDEFTDEGVKVYRYRWRFDNFGGRNSLPFRIINRILKETGLMDRDIKSSLSRYNQALLNIISEHRIDIVEMPDYHDYIRFTRSYIPFPSLPVPVVVKMNGSLTYFAKEAGKPITDHIFKAEQSIIDQATAIAAVSNYTATKSAEYFSYPKIIAVLANGIDTNIAMNSTRDPHQVIFTGTLVQKKGIYQLAKAWNIVAEQKPNARLLILGKGPQKKIAALLTEQAKKTVAFMGHINMTELYQHLSSSAIAVFPSYSEAFALAPLEAMACGAAVINTNRTSGPELITHNIDGLLIDPDNIEELANAILHLLNDPADRQRLAANGTIKVKEKFDIEKIAAKNLAFYINVKNIKSMI